MTVIVFSSVVNPCKEVCSHLCLLRPGGYTCACPQGSSPVSFDQNECDAGVRHVTLQANTLKYVKKKLAYPYVLCNFVIIFRIFFM